MEFCRNDEQVIESKFDRIFWFFKTQRTSLW